MTLVPILAMTIDLDALSTGDTPLLIGAYVLAALFVTWLYVMQEPWERTR